MEPFETKPLEPNQIGEATGVLLRSFHSALQFVAVCPNPAKRLRLLRIFFGVAVRDALAHGHIDVASGHGRVAGVAVWLPPGHVVMTPARQARAALPMSRIGFFAPRALSRLARLGTVLDAAHPGEPHWYLSALAVDTTVQGQRVGSQLLRDGLARAEATRYGCYLETMLERNVRLYRRFGFEVVREEQGLVPGGPPFWFMWRAPQG
ncbi:MAG: GNAT family N-acetyltransferase [Deinococcota bacterium]|nr:GNAT family N-acetyltransferase [Deinococcota bacterium]